jgi:hypothetical protein
VNAAFLLVTTTLLAGQNAPSNNGASDNKPAPATTAPAVTAPANGGCCGAASSCGCCESGWSDGCCGGGRHGLFSRLRGGCFGGGHSRGASWGGDCGCSGYSSGCDSCGFGGGHGHGGGLFSRLRNRFRGGDCCVSDCGCGSGGYGGYGGAVIAPNGAPGVKPEQIQTQPKEDMGNKLPKGGDNEEKKSGNAEPPSAQLRPSIPAAPALETAAPLVPNVPANNQEQRDPPF